MALLVTIEASAHGAHESRPVRPANRPLNALMCIAGGLPHPKCEMRILAGNSTFLPDEAVCHG
jgi:hypothetical protein